MSSCYRAFAQSSAVSLSEKPTLKIRNGEYYKINLVFPFRSASGGEEAVLSIAEYGKIKRVLIADFLADCERDHA